MLYINASHVLPKLKFKLKKSLFNSFCLIYQLDKVLGNCDQHAVLTMRFTRVYHQPTELPTI